MKSINNIPKTMMAVRSYAPNDNRYEEIPVPQINEDEVLVKVEACGICAGDTKSYHGAAMFWGGGVLPPWTKVPVVGGHEFIGEVVAIGDNAAKKHNLEIGDRAIAEQIVSCGECKFCKSGSHWMCQHQNIHGHQGEVADGGMAQYMKYGPNDIVHKVPKHIPAEHAAMIEPLSCSVHTVERAKIEMNDIVVVAGMGPIGLCKIQYAKLKSPKMVIAVDINPKRLEIAKKLGADVVINPKECDAVQAVLDLTDGYGCDVYINSTGHPSGVIQGLQMVRKLGTFVEFGVFGAETSVDWSIIGDRKEMTIYGAHISGRDGYEIAIRTLADGSIKVDDIVTHKFPLKDWKEAFELQADGKESIKVVLIP